MLAIIRYIKQHYPQVEVHLSTQASTMNYEAALFYKSMGVDRIVLARELSKDEIKEIIDKASIDIEVFIHGAMCTCVSGFFYKLLLLLLNNKEISFYLLLSY